MSGHLGQSVIHVQAGLGVGVDVSKFHWHREVDDGYGLDEVLGTFFDIEKITEGRSLYYVCTKRETP